MLHIVPTGTDVASIVIFDPATLPPDFDERRDTQAEVLRRLHAEQKIFQIETGADGAYLVYVFVDEPIRSSLMPYLKEPITLEHFDLLSGRVYCTGTEYAFRNNDSGLERHPQMGGQFTVAPGTYRLRFYRTEYPDGIMEEELQRLVSPAAFNLHRNFGCLVGLGVLGALVAGTGFLVFPVTTWTTFVVPLALFLVALPFIVSRLRLVKATNQVWKEVQQRFPSIVAEFRSGTAS